MLRSIFLGFLMLGLAACALTDIAARPQTPADASAEFTPSGVKTDLIPRIAVATAFAPELEALLPRLSNKTRHQVNGVSFWTGTISDQDVVLFMTGVSLVNAAMNTQLVLERFDITHIVVSGIAGGVDPGLSIGDVTVPAKWGQYNETVYMREVEPGVYEPHAETRPPIAEYGFIRPRGVWVASASNTTPEPRFWFEADEDLLEIAKSAAQTIELKQCVSDDQCLDRRPQVVVGGAGVSGSIFLDNADFREYLFDTFDAQVAEMETSSIAMVAYANDTPYVAFRSLSDLAGGGGAGENEMAVFGALAAENAAAFVVAFLDTLGAQSAEPDMAAATTSPFCELNYATMASYSGNRLGAERLAKLQAVTANEDEYRAFVSSFNDLTTRIAAVVSRDLSLTSTDVLGGYKGTTSPSLSGIMAAPTEEDRASAALIGAALGYVYLQESVIIQCNKAYDDAVQMPSFNLVENGSLDILSPSSLKSIYGMMIGEADGELSLGFTYYPAEDRFSSLGFSDSGAVESKLLDTIETRLDSWSQQPENMERRDETRWVRFVGNDWTLDPSGIGYFDGLLSEAIKPQLDALQSEYIAAIDRLPNS